MEKTSISIKSLNVFISRNFYVTPDIVGKSHYFDYEGALVSLHLPGESSPIKRGGDCTEVVIPTNYRTETKEILQYEIREVYLEIDFKERISIHKDVLK
jgi:hypothetical protein